MSSRHNLVGRNRGFVKEFDPLISWTSDFCNLLVHTEINSSTLTKKQIDNAKGVSPNQHLIHSKYCCMFVDEWFPNPLVNTDFNMFVYE